MPNEKKLTREEVEKLRKLQDQEAEVVYEFGSAEIRIQTFKRNIDRLSERKDELMDELNNITKERESYRKTLRKKYGNVSIDVETGEVTEKKKR